MSISSFDNAPPASPSPDTETTTCTTPPPTETDTCRYSSKPCSNPRAVKKTGDLHSFCEFHRLMANRNQRRCEQKRRSRKQFERAIHRRVLQQTQQPSLPASLAIDVASAPVKNPYKRRRSNAHASPTSVDAAGSVAVPVIEPLAVDDLEIGEPIPFFEPSNHTPEPTLELEPFRHPVPLHDEDLQFLFMAVVDATEPLNPHYAFVV